MPKHKFTPGTPKPEGSGRKKGVKDKKTIIKEELDKLRYADPVTFQNKIAELSTTYFEELEKLKGEQFVRAYEKLVNYLHPQKTKSEVILRTPDPIKIEISDYRGKDEN